MLDDCIEINFKLFDVLIKSKEVKNPLPASYFADSTTMLTTN